MDQNRGLEEVWGNERGKNGWEGDENALLRRNWGVVDTITGKGLFLSRMRSKTAQSSAHETTRQLAQGSVVPALASPLDASAGFCLLPLLAWNEYGLLQPGQPAHPSTKEQITEDN